MFIAINIYENLYKMLYFIISTFMFLNVDKKLNLINC